MEQGTLMVSWALLGIEVSVKNYDKEHYQLKWRGYLSTLASFNLEWLQALWRRGP